MKLKEISTYIDNLLDVFRIPDSSKNSLQVADTIKNKEITKIGFSVDATNDAIEKAISDLDAQTQDFAARRMDNSIKAQRSLPSFFWRSVSHQYICIKMNNLKFTVTTR